MGCVLQCGVFFFFLALQIRIFDQRNQSLLQENRALEQAFNDAVDKAQREESLNVSSQAKARLQRLGAGCSPLSPSAPPPPHLFCGASSVRVLRVRTCRLRRSQSTVCDRPVSTVLRCCSWSSLQYRDLEAELERQRVRLEGDLALARADGGAEKRALQVDLQRRVRRVLSYLPFLRASELVSPSGLL